MVDFLTVWGSATKGECLGRQAETETFQLLMMLMMMMMEMEMECYGGLES